MNSVLQDSKDAQNKGLAGEQWSDDALLFAISHGDAEAMEPLYNRYRRLLYTMAYQMVIDHYVAEDLLQDTFFAVWRHAASYSQQSGAVYSWLLSILYHRTVDYLRHTRRRSTMKLVALDEVDLEAYLSISDAWDEVWIAAQMDEVRTALQKLPPEQRIVVEYVYFHEWTTAELARQYHIPLGTIKGRLRLGLAHLRKVVEISE